MNGMTPEQKKLIDQYLDPDGELEIASDLLAKMTPREIALADQLLTARFEIAKILSGGRPFVAMSKAICNITKLDLLLSEVRSRRNQREG